MCGTKELVSFEITVKNTSVVMVELELERVPANIDDGMTRHAHRCEVNGRLQKISHSQNNWDSFIVVVLITCVKCLPNSSDNLTSIAKKRQLNRKIFYR